MKPAIPYDPQRLQERAELASSLQYFWTEKGDITRASDFDREAVRREFPGVLMAWDNYVTARLVMEEMVKAAVRAADTL